MNVTFRYFAQIREAAGVESEQIQIPEGRDVTLALKQAAMAHGDAFGALVLSDDGEVRPSLVLLVNSIPVPRGTPRELHDGDEIRVFSPVAGG